jgi:aryl-alcohol dehydrogenase-like predicted oxidoreductase
MGAVVRTSGLEVSAIGLGCTGMTGECSHRPDAADIGALIHSAVERGVSFFDAADASGPHASEELVGQALEPCRYRVVIATDFAQDIHPVERTHHVGGCCARRRCTGGRGPAAAPRRRSDRPLLPAPGQPRRSQRGAALGASPRRNAPLPCDDIS